MKLWDARVCLGMHRDLAPFQSSDMDSVRRMLDKYRVERAFLVSFASFTLDIFYGNDVTFQAAAKDARLIPCATVIPDSAGEVGDERAFLRELVQQGARCVGLYPKTFGVALDERIVGALFEALESLRLPVMIPADEADLFSVADRALQHPNLPVVLVTPDYRNRNLYRMLKGTPNLHITINAGFAPNEGIEEIVKRCGPNQLLYASNSPVSEPGATIAFLMYSRISEEHLHAIAVENMQRLVNGVRNA